MTITATELKNNLVKYLDIVTDEDIFISKNGKIIAFLSKPQSSKLAALNSLVGIADNGQEVSFDEIKNERLKKQ